MKTRNVREKQWRRYFRKMESLDPTLPVCLGYLRHMNDYARQHNRHPYVFPADYEIESYVPTFP